MRPDSTKLLRRMREAMAHRGPDDAGEWWSPDGTVGLAHRRLAILDLFPRGRQPMSDSTGRLWITFNGEIYNFAELRAELLDRGYTFRTETDTEVILNAYHAWGEDCLARLDGMFAFVLYDSTRRLIFMARDRAGEKPLFYWHSSNSLTFASELKGLMVLPALTRRLDVRAFEEFLAFGYVTGERCILEQVQKLPQAHAAIYDVQTGRFRRWRYWTVGEPKLRPAPSADVLADELQHRLQSAVRRQLVADVPVGLLLSGGIDSSLVVATAASIASKPLKTFTVCFPGTRSHDESAHARVVADYFGTDHMELIAEEASPEICVPLAAQFDEPLGDSSIIPTYLVSSFIRKHATVALSGDGGDELFAGYRHYAWLLAQARFRKCVPEAARCAIAALTARCLPVGFPGRNYLIGLGGGDARAIAHVNLFFDLRARRRLAGPALKMKLNDEAAPEARRETLCESGRTLIYQATWADFQSYLVDDILVKVDRASMLASLEMRAPWLDCQVVEFAFQQVPDQLKAIPSLCKILPRRLAARLLPANLNTNRKQGFALPLQNWFRGRWGAFIKSVVQEADPEIWDRAAIRRLVSAQEIGCRNAQRLFAVAMFELWRRAYNVWACFAWAVVGL